VGWAYWRMPTILRSGPFRFYFYSNEQSEPPHVHVECRGAVAKLWIAPVTVASPGLLRPSELRDAIHVAQLHETTFLEAWHAYFRWRHRLPRD